MAAAGRGGGTGRSVHEPEQQHQCRAVARMAAAGWSGSGWRSTKILGSLTVYSATNSKILLSVGRKRVYIESHL